MFKRIIHTILFLLGLLLCSYIAVLCIELDKDDWRSVKDFIIPSKFNYRTLYFDSPNPTNYVYNAPANKVRSLLAKHFYDCFNMTNDFAKLHSEFPVVNKEDFSFSQYYSRSFLYQYKDEPLEMNYFQLHVDSLTPTKTMVTVFTLRSEVLIKRGINYTETTKVSPSTIMEYSILYYLGLLLKEKDMPTINFPSELTRQQILDIYKSLNYGISPFKESDLFKN